MPAPKPPVRPVRRRGLLIALVVLLVLLTALTLSLPALMSTPWGLRKTLDLVNARIPAKLFVGDWKVSWLSPPEMNHVRVVDARNRDILQAGRIIGTRSLASLAFRSDLGDFTFHQAQLTLDAPAGTAADQEKQSQDGRPARQPGAASNPGSRSGPEASASTPWPRQKARVILTDATVALRGADGRVTNIFSQVQMIGALNTTNTLASLRGHAALPTTGGEIELECDITGRPEPGMGSPPLHNETRLLVKKLPAGPALDFARAFVSLPSGEGIWDADLAASGSTAKGFKWKGSVSGASVAFSGGPLGPDRLQLGTLSLYTRGEMLARGFHGAEFHLTNDLARVDLSVRESDSFRQSASMNADVNLAGLVRQLPGLFRLKDGVAMENGRLLLKAAAEGGKGGQTNVTGEVRLENVSGSLNGKIISFSKPFLLNGAARLLADRWRVERMDATTPLGNFGASGDDQEGRLTLAFPLEQAFLEAGQFFDLGAWDPAGMVTVQLQQTSSGQVRRVSLDLRSPGLSLAKSGAPLVKNHPVSLVLNAQIPMDPGVLSARAVQLIFQLPFFRGNFTADRIVAPEMAGGLPRVDGLGISGIMNLSGLLDALFAADLTAKPSPFATARLELLKVKGGLNGRQMELPVLDWKLSGLSTRPSKQEAAHPIPEIDFTGHLVADPLSGAFTITNSVVRANGLPMQVEDFSCPDLSRLPDSLAIRLNAAPELKPLLALVGLFTGIPPDVRVGGRMAIKAGLENNLAAISMVAQDFKYQRGSGPVYQDPQMRLDARVDLPDDNGRIVVRDVRLITGVATLSGRGVVDPTHALFEGDLAYDLARLTKLIKELGVEEVALSGRQSSPWRLRLPLQSKQESSAVFSARLAADQVEGYGLSFKNIELPLFYSNQVARLVLDGEFEGGRVHAAPILRFDGPTTSLFFDTTRPLIEDVKLTPDLATRLLARLHPIFKGASLLEGRMTLELKDFEMPISPDWQKSTRFSGVLRLRGVKVTSSGLLQEALSAARIKEQSFDLGDQDLPFVCVDGRVETKALLVNIKGTPVTFAGSVGLDTTLRYAASTPATESLLREWGLGSDIIKHLKNPILTLPITGTVARPEIDQDAFRRQFEKIAKNAGKDALEEKARDLLDNLLDKKKKPKKEEKP